MRVFLLHQKAVLYTMAALIVAGVSVVFITRPAQPTFWIGVVVLGLGVTASITSAVLAKQRSKRFLDDRATLSDEEIYRQHFAESGLPQSLVLELWHEVADVLHLPVGKLRPADRFGQELGGYWITSDYLDALGQVAAARARRQGVIFNLAEIGTLDEYVRRFAAIGERPTGPGSQRKPGADHE